MHTIHCLIVEDEPLAQQVLQTHIRTAGLQLAATCFTAEEAFAQLHQHSIDLVFLDIKMPGITGTAFIQSLKNPPPFIFTTAYADFALQGFELNAVDYLLKPITYERFSKSIHKFLRQQPAKEVREKKDYCYIKTNGALQKLYYREILYAQSMKDYIKIYTATGTYLTHLTMKALQELLPATRFIRIHRSYMVNTAHITVFGKDYVTIHGAVLPVGENYRCNLQPPK